MTNSSFTSQFATLPPQAVVEFREIFKRKYGIELSQEEATQKAIHVFNFIGILAKKPIAPRGKEDIK